MSTGIYSRRDFLKTSAAAAAALSLAPGGLADDSNRGSEAALRWGVIGAGNRAHSAHFPAIKKLNMEILGVCDVMEDHLARGLATAGEKAQGYTDYQKLLANPDINAVVIATPSFLHCEMVIAALEAGKHVLCEKPMAIEIEKGKAMKKAADASDRTVVYGMQFPHSPYWQTMHEQITSGRIGRPTHLMWRLYRTDWNPRGWLYTDPKTGRKINWRLSQAASGGILSDEGIHYFDLLNWMADGLPESLQCNGATSAYTHDGRDTWDHAITNLAYGNGCIGTLDASLYAPNYQEMQVLGENGSIRAEFLPHMGAAALWFETRGRGKREQIATPDEVFENNRGAGMVETAVLMMYQDLVDCIREKRKPIVDSDRIFNSDKVVWLTNVSAQRGQVVDWNVLS